jgi:tRNA-specific 2-thiouridylase
MLKELKKNKKVFVAMSGGVDSSVAALLLKNQDYDVTGVFMRCYNLDGCSERDAVDARRVTEKLKTPFFIWDFEEEYKKRVVDYMVKGYEAGITPNPDVMCNREIKFGLFLNKALEMGADYIASGHYIKIQNSKFKVQNDNSKFKIIYNLLEAKDRNKDQTYFLWTLTQEQLKHCLFPIGDYLKSEVREMARKAGLPTAEKKDSQGICFLGKVTLDEFLANYIPEKRGIVLDVAGEKIGEHKGAHFYTIGQRHIKAEIRNLSLREISRRETNHKFQTNSKSQIQNSKNRKPYYVAEKDIRANTLVVAEGSGNPALYKKEIELTDVNLVNSQWSIVNGRRVLARVRYRQPLAEARIYKLKANSYKLIFDAPQKFVASGQSAVFYDKRGEMLGGGIII